MIFNYSDILEYLNNTYFKEIWNSIRAEDRINMVLPRITDRLQSGVIVLKYMNIKLPIDGAFSIHSLPTSLTRPLISVRENVWYNALDVIKTNHINVFIYDINGRTIPTVAIWFYKPTGSTKLIVAIERDAVRYCTTDDLEIHPKLYITMFNDIDRTTPLDIYSTQVVSTGDVAESIKNINTQLIPYKENASVKTTFYVNGWIHGVNDLPELTRGDYVEVRVDDDITIGYSVNVDDTHNGYYSERYSGYREIIHTPKDMNPDNQVFTHNSITFLVRDPTTNKSVYYHRIQPFAVRNITHNDYSLDRDVLSAFKDALGAATVVVDVRIRNGAVPTYLKYDKYAIKELYNDTDANIIEHLHGGLDSSMYFWKASNLEQSPYINMMFYMYDNTHSNLVDDYVNGLGYYEIGSLLSKNNYTSVYTGGSVFLYKPYILYNKPVYVHVYHNGVKIPEYKYTYSDYGIYTVITLEAELSNDLKNETLTYGVFEKNSSCYRVFVPTKDDYKFTFTGEDIYMYEIYKYDTPITDYAQCYGKVYDTGFIPVNTNNFDITKSSSNTNTITFNTTQVDRLYVSVETVNSRYLYFNIDDYLNEDKAIILSLLTEIDSGGVVNNLPPLASNSYKVFLNGHWLIENMDFSIASVYDNDDRLLDQHLVISNKNFLDLTAGTDTDNFVEVYISSDYSISNDSGFTDNGYIKRGTQPCVWYDRIGWLFVEGKNYLDTTAMSTHFTMLSSPTTGEPYNIHLDWNYRLHQLLLPLSGSGDEELKIQDAVMKYFNRKYPVTKTINPIFKEHSIYSPFITRVIDDIRSKRLFPSDDYNEVTFMKQFDSYKNLMDSDPTLSVKHPVDRSLVSVGASYSYLDGMDPVNTRIIMRLINLTLKRAEHTIGKTYV